MAGARSPAISNTSQSLCFCPRPDLARATVQPSRLYLGTVAEPNPNRQTDKNGGATGDADSLAPWTEGERTFTADDDFFLRAEDYEDEGEVDELGEPVDTIDELGRRHVYRAAPEGTEQILENEAPRRSGLPDGIERWRQRSATGAVLTAFAFGLQSVFEPERKEPAIVMQTSGEPPMDLPVEAQLEQLGPRQSTVTVRSWLLPGADQGEDTTDDDPETGETSAE